MTQPLDITFVGRHCRFSAIVLAALIDAGHRVNLVILPQHRDSGVHILQRPSLKPRLMLAPSPTDPAMLPTVAGLAWGAGALLVEVSRDQLDTLPHRFDRLRKGVLVTACFPWTLPSSTLATPPLGALNLHPSLLPAHRGPDPIFWTLHAGDPTTGATIHQMTADLDAGPIVAQASFAIPLRIRYQELEDRAVRLGARLLIDVLNQLPDLHALPTPSSRPLEPYPTARHLIIDHTWSAERAFRFAYGAAPTFGPLTVQLADGTTLSVTDATTLHLGETMQLPISRRADQATIPFADGLVEFTIHTPT